MPIYAYKCSACGHAADEMHKVSDAALTVCPQCGETSYTKQVTAAGFALKGSGWYATDFKNGPAAPKNETKAETAAPACGTGGCSGCAS
ncbi:MAG: zinc ribbon domain-containing protein [Betaproteobacteria bacterium]|nr:MAG: zinc ribbon domain-containing protein [Betaproteobacteria bacterium]